jgi:holin-like protein
MIASVATLILLPFGLEVITRSLSIPFPGSVAGYVLLLAYLAVRGETPPELRRVAEGLIRLLPLFLVPAGLGVLGQSSVTLGDVLPLAAAIVIGTLLGILATAITFVAILRARSYRGPAVAFKRIAGLAGN